jgi:hypothetical protein
MFIRAVLFSMDELWYRFTHPGGCSAAEKAGQCPALMEEIEELAVPDWRASSSV